MNIIETIPELQKALTNKKFMQPLPTNSLSYNGLFFQCPDNSHSFTDISLEIMATALPVHFLIDCGFVTHVQVKGLFKQKSIVHWSCCAELFFEISSDFDL